MHCIVLYAYIVSIGFCALDSINYILSNYLYCIFCFILYTLYDELLLSCCIKTKFETHFEFTSQPTNRHCHLQRCFCSWNNSLLYLHAMKPCTMQNFAISVQLWKVFFLMHFIFIISPCRAILLFESYLKPVWCILKSCLN